jgi:hypothetical protein
MISQVTKRTDSCVCLNFLSFVKFLHWQLWMWINGISMKSRPRLMWQSYWDPEIITARNPFFCMFSHFVGHCSELSPGIPFSGRGRSISEWAFWRFSDSGTEQTSQLLTSPVNQIREWNCEPLKIIFPNAPVGYVLDGWHRTTEKVFILFPKSRIFFSNMQLMCVFDG